MRNIPKKMKEHKPDCFKPGDSLKKAHKNNPKKMEKEFVRQLKDQEKGLNELSVGEYIENRRSYTEIGRKGTGQAQQAAREVLREDISDSIKTNLITKKGIGPAKAQKIANERAESIMESLAALHDPDMVAGGHDKISRVATKMLILR